MSRRATVAAYATLTILAAPTTASAAPPPVVTGGCHVEAKANVKPGLTIASHPFAFSYEGRLDSCFYTGTGAADGGAISAGKQITIDGRRYQEPLPAGSGSCVVTEAEGYDFAFWNNGTQTIVKYKTTSVGGITHITGSVWPSLTLAAVNPGPGDPKSITFNTTNFNGQTVFGLMQFGADPLLCGTPAGTEAATISGNLGHYGPATPTTAPSLKCSATPAGEACTSPGYQAPIPTVVTKKRKSQRCSSTRQTSRGKSNAGQRRSARRCHPKRKRPKHKPVASRPTPQPVPAMALTSSAFAGGAGIPRRYTCLGGMVSPPLTWNDVPAATRELDLLVTDATRDNLSHWVVYAIPPTDTSSLEGAAPSGAKQGRNEFGLDGYLPPCPLAQSDAHHKYVFELFASNQALGLPPHANDHAVRAALAGHTLATATLTGTYKLGD